MPLDQQLLDPSFRAAYLRDLVLSRYDEGDACCAMGAVSLLAGHACRSDVPEGVSVVLGALVRCLNDNADDRPRQELLPLLPRLLNSADEAADRQREAVLRRAIEDVVLRGMQHRLTAPLRNRIGAARTRRQVAAAYRAAARHLLHPVGLALHAEAAMALAAAALEEDPSLAALLACQALGSELRCNPDAVWGPALDLLDALIELDGCEQREAEIQAA